MLTEKQWDGVSDHLMTGVDRLVAGGANTLVIASNTGHIAVRSRLCLLVFDTTSTFVHIATLCDFSDVLGDVIFVAIT
jgi:aspartate/glutamate racemase